MSVTSLLRLSPPHHHLEQSGEDRPTLQINNTEAQHNRQVFLQVHLRDTQGGGREEDADLA